MTDHCGVIRNFVQKDGHEREIAFWKAEMDKVVDEKNAWVDKYMKVSCAQRASCSFAQKGVSLALHAAIRRA